MGVDADIRTVRSTIRARAETIVPRATALTEAGWAELEAIVCDALRQRPAALRRQLVLCGYTRRRGAPCRWSGGVERVL